jgi:hypothetical protein
MPASPQQAVTRRRKWLWIAAAVALAAAAAFDWSRPPQQQLSVRLFDRAVIGSYRKFVRPVTKRVLVCRFRPTCSAYGQTAIYLHGFPKGFWLTTKRLVRCNPWTPRDASDPVPPPRVRQ